MKQPKISIVTITYNSEKTVEETFKSVKAQGYANLEYIVVDGGSTDATLEIASRYSDVISVLKSEKDEGISDAMNKGIALATGDLIGLIHSDDMLVEGALDKLAAVWDGETDVYYGDAIVCSEEGEHLSILTAKEDLSDMPYHFCIVHPATFVAKKAYEAYGNFDKSLKCAMDYDLLLRMYRAGARFQYLHENLSVYRLGGTNMKMRRRTVDEVRDVSVRHGGDPKKANAIRRKKLFKDKIRPIIKFFGLKNKRVQKI